MKSHPLKYRDDENLDSPFLESELWEREYLKKTKSFAESEDLFPTEEQFNEWEEENLDEDSFEDEYETEDIEEDNEFKQDMDEEAMEHESMAFDLFDDETEYHHADDEDEETLDDEFDAEDIGGGMLGFYEDSESEEYLGEEIDDEIDDDSAEVEKYCPACSSELEESEGGGYCPSCSQEVAEMELESEGYLQLQDEISYLNQAIIYVALASSWSKGVRNINELTDVGFNVLHPKRKGKPISKSEPDFQALVDQWKELKANVVVPFANKLKKSKGGSKPSGGSSGKTGPLAIINTPMPEPLSNEYRLKKSSRNKGGQYGISLVISAVKWIAKKWHQLHPEIVMGIGDISKKGGGELYPHKSHRLGLDVDIGLTVRKTDGEKEKRIGWYKPFSKAGVHIVSMKDYNSKYRQIMKEFLALIANNKIIPVKVIYYWDHELSTMVPKGKSSAIHYKHVHIRFCRPPELKSALNGKKVKFKANSYDCGGQAEFYQDEILSDDNFSYEHENDFFEKELSSSDLASAVQYNQKKAKSLGWYKHFDDIVAAVLRLNYSPNEEVFAQKVADWQISNGLGDDGKIGPSTWKKMKSILGLTSGSSSSSAPLGSQKKRMAAIAAIIAANRGAFGISKADEKIAARFWYRNEKKHPNPRFNAIKPYNIDKIAETLKGHGSHIIFSQNLFSKTSFDPDNSGNDINFVLAIATREGGTRGLTRKDNTKVSSAGRDTHRDGVSGLDYLWRGKKYFGEAGIFIKPVPKSALVPKRKDRVPAYVYAKHLMFAHMVEVARRERKVVWGQLSVALKKMGVKGSPSDHLTDLNQNAHRAWLALSYSGDKYVQEVFKFLIKDQQRRGVDIDFNEIMTNSFKGFKRFYWSKVMLARATSLRAHVFDQFL